MTTYRRIEAVRKTGEILKFLANVKEPASGPEVAKAVGLPTGTAMCHLATLEDLGFVLTVGDRFQAGMGLALFWARVKSTLEAQRDKINKNLDLLNQEER